MADTLVDGDVQNTLDTTSRGPHGPYWHDISIGAIILTNLANDLVVRRTTDKGANWTETTIFTGTVSQVSCWFDKETPGNTGTLLHITWIDSAISRIYYRSYDLSDGTLGTLRNIQAAASTLNQEINEITVARNGDIHIVYIEISSATDHLRSGDGGATWDSVTSPMETYGDGIFMFPANTGDDADIAGLYGDADPDEYSLKMWDNSAGTWTETAIVAVVTVNIQRRYWDGVIRLSDGHLMAALLTNFNSGTADMLAYDITLDSIASPTITAKTNVFDNDATLAMACWMNQNNDEWRVLWQGGSVGSSATVLYKVSTDGGGTWGGEQQYNETIDDIRMLSAGRAAFSTGGRFQPAWFEDDLNDVWVNEVNDVEIAAAVVITRGLRKLRGVGA